jgi:hypothetical protein
MVREPGTKLMLTITWMFWVTDVYPGAKAVIDADPGLTPVIFGSGEGLIEPTPIKTLGGTVKIEGSLLVRPTSMNSAAGAGKTTVNASDCPCPTASLENNFSTPADATTMLMVVSGTFGGALAWIVVVPTAKAVARTLKLSPPSGKTTVAGTVTMLVSSEVKLTASPPAGAGADRFIVKS